MQSVIFFLVVIGAFMIMHGIYEQKYNAILQNRRIEYRFLPRTYYEEQVAETDVIGKLKNVFNKGVDPWFDRNVTIPPPQKNKNIK
jgi:hypothetical protein